MYNFNIDRGGTFTDFYVQKICQDVVTEEHCFKVPSRSAQGEGPIVGIRQFLAQRSLQDPNAPKINCQGIKSVNIGTTIATNALLQRKGVNSAVIVSEGFDDILSIRNQTRPNIFDLTCSKPQPLTNNVLTIDSRLYNHRIPETQLKQVKNNVFYQPASKQRLRQLIERLKQLEVQSIGVSLCNSYLSSEAEDQIEAELRSNGFANIEKGSNYVQLGYLKRTETASLDCYLNPITKQYFNAFAHSFEDPDVQVRIMKSDGGFARRQSARASELLLSGPAGGLIGYSRMSDQLWKLFGLQARNLVGLDMGGTSTDVSVVRNKQIDLKYTFQAEGIEICTPHLEIDTIAAGGGSKLGYSNGMLTVGPESVGSDPGPVCYGIGDELAITDANLLLNRLDVSFFPKVFGKNRNSQPDVKLTIQAFERLSKVINCESKQKPKSMQEIAEGYLELANELMAKSARKILTLGQPDALVVFGSAGGQHCCDIAQKIGVQHIIVHKFSGILSAYGLSKAYETKQNKIYLGVQISAVDFSYAKFRDLIDSKCKQVACGPEMKYEQCIEQVSIAYLGTSFSLQVLLGQNMLEQFQVRHREHSGFSLPNKHYKIEYFIRTYVKKPLAYNIEVQATEEVSAQAFKFEEAQVFLNGRFQAVPKYKLNGMSNCRIIGPALIFSATSSILVQENWKAHVVHESIHLEKLTTKLDTKIIHKQEESGETIECDPIKLTIFSTRLMGIAEEMGKVLQKTSISTNIKQRLDFSCGIFDWDGALLANAPHLPVHLGSMETAVTEQIKRGIKPGDVILSNHPAAGGSHLPDLTVISCFQIAEGLNFYVASRGHHADIGGTTPGSMPPFSRTLAEEGVAISKFELIYNSEFRQKQTRELFKDSRRQNDNISDLLAQISANQFGIKLLRVLIAQFGHTRFKEYVKFVCQNAEHSVQEMLHNFSVHNQLDAVHSIESTQYMDDGTALKLKLTIDRQQKRAVFDFTGTGQEVVGNTNAPKSITRSAVLYCIRSLLGKQIPLNSGCLWPITLIIPENSILSPSPTAAVVGGNVQTSQKLVDLILKPFNRVACSQGTMNNFLFGSDKLSYYQTICGGSGAGDGHNGTTTQCHMTNTRITDVEHLQRYYPVVLLQFRKRAGSGGAGKYQGGDGAIRELMFMEEMQISVLSERRIYSPYGLQGGQSGQTGRNTLITAGGIRKNIGSKNCFRVRQYDRVVIETPGGGGYGQANQ